MKYMVFGEYKEPIEDNMKKMYEVEKRRIEKGTAFSDYVFPMHTCVTQLKSFFVVDVDESEIMRWVSDYGPLVNAEIYPIVERSTWQKAIK